MNRLLLIESESITGGTVKSLASAVTAQGYQAARLGLDSLEGIDAAAIALGDAFKGQPPTLILLDLSMPKMSGWEVLKVIRGDDTLKHIPVITITAQVMAGDRERALEAGFDGYIPKPISVSSIIKTIQEILRSRGTLIDNVQVQG